MVNLMKGGTPKWPWIRVGAFWNVRDGKILGHGCRLIEPPNEKIEGTRKEKPSISENSLVFIWDFGDNFPCLPGLILYSAQRFGQSLNAVPDRPGMEEGRPWRAKYKLFTPVRGSIRDLRSSWVCRSLSGTCLTPVTARGAVMAPLAHRGDGSTEHPLFCPSLSHTAFGFNYF